MTAGKIVLEAHFSMAAVVSDKQIA